MVGKGDVMETNRRALIEELVNNLFVLNGDNQEKNSGDGEWRIDPNVSLTLTFMFPAQMYLRAIESLDSKNIIIYHYQGNTENEKSNFNFEKDLNDAMILVPSVSSDEIVQNGVVDLDSWCCSCFEFTQSFKPTKVITTQHIGNHTFGMRIGFTTQFTDTQDHRVPICQHLLASYILKKHHSKLLNSYAIKPLERHQWLNSHSTLIHHTQQPSIQH